MATSVWEGHLRLSLVTCPVALYKATDPKGGIDFHLINPKTKSRIVQVVKDPTTGQELDRKTLVRGFEVAKNQYVLIDPEELKALRIESTHVLDLERFVDALEPHDNRILLTTLRTHEDIVTASDVGGIAKLPKPDRRMLEIAEKIIEQQEGKFDPSTFKDRYEDAVRDLIARKKRGQKVTTAPPVEKDDGKVINLMEALRRSLAGQGSGSKERAERFLERTKSKAIAKARPKTKTSAA